MRTSVPARGLAGLVAIVAVAALGCFDPKFPNATIMCASANDCPSGYVCSNGLCYQRGAGGAASETAGGTGGPAGAGSGGRGGGGGGAGASAVGGHAGGTAGGGGQAAGGSAGHATGGATGAGGMAGAGTGGGGGTCQPACTLGDARCGSTGLQTCVSVGGCPTWSSEVACSGRKTCQGTAPAAGCVCPAAPAGCTGAGTVCGSGGVVTCAVDGDGCVYSSGVAACAAGEPCGGTFPHAACTCPTAPAVCNSKAGTFCNAGNTQVVTCALDSAQCLVVTSMITCAHGCSGTAGAASCGSCPAPPAECTSGGTLCTSDGQLEGCGLDSSGCLANLGAKPCDAPTACQGALPNATCACPAVPPICAAGAGTTCASDGVTVVTCGMQSGCMVQTATKTCTSPQVCSGNVTVAGCACATVAACQAGAGAYCDSSGDLITCTTSSGCLAAMTKTCSGGQACAGSFPSATCSCPAPTDGCGSVPGTTCASDTSVRTCTMTSGGCIQGQTSSCSSGQYCWSSMSKCAAPITVGYASDLGATASVSSGYLAGEAVTISGSFTVRGFGIISNAASGGVSMGLYTDVNGLPSQLVAKAQNQAIVLAAPNKNEYPASPAATGGTLTLPAGTYWIMADLEMTTAIRAGATGGSTITYALVMAGWNSLPSTLTGVGTLTHTPVNQYLLITQ